MPSDGDEYRLKWQTHVPSLCTEFLELRKNESMVDVTLVCKGGTARGHRLLLSSCSPLLEALLSSSVEHEATILLPDVPVGSVRSLLEYIYTGEIAVHDSEIDALVDAANLLHIRGIAGSVTSAAAHGKRPRPATLPLPLNFPFPYPLPTSAPSPQPLPSPQHLLTSPMPSPLGMRVPVLNSPTKSLLRKNLVAGISDKRKTPVKKSTSNENLSKRKSPSIEDLSTKKDGKTEEEGKAKKLKNEEGEEEKPLIRCSTPLFVDTKSPDESESRPNRSNSDRSDGSADNQRVTTTSQDVADDTVSSLNSSLLSEAETNLLHPQMELSEGVGRITIKPEFSYSTSPLSSPVLKISTSPCPPELGDALDAKSGACVFCKKHFVSADDLKDHISRVHMSDNRLEKQFKCDYCPAAFARSAHLKRHVRTHTGERPYACTVCPRAFSRQDKLKCHMDRHTEEERRKLQAANADSSPILPTSSPASMQSYINSLNRSLQLASPSSASLSAAEALYGSALSTTNVGNHGNSGSGAGGSSGSSNPGMPYLQNILDEVQIVRDKKPPSYYRHIKKTDNLVTGLRKLAESPIKMAATVE